MSDVKIEHTVMVSRDEAAAWLSVLSKAFAADGHVELTLGPSEVKVHVPDRLQAELEVEVEGEEVEIELEFTWSRAQLEAAFAATTAQRPLAKPRPQRANGARTSARAARRLANALSLSAATDEAVSHSGGGYLCLPRQPGSAQARVRCPSDALYSGCPHISGVALSWVASWPAAGRGVAQEGSVQLEVALPVLGDSRIVSEEACCGPGGHRR